MMKRLFRPLLAAAMVLTLSAQASLAADKRFINFNIGKSISVETGVRAALDAAVYSSDYEDLESGLRGNGMLFEGKISYRDNLSFVFDIDVLGELGRDLYVEFDKGFHTVKGGFFRDPSSMSMNTYRYDYHFITRSSTVNTLMNENCVFGASYKYSSNGLFAEQSVFMSEGPDNLKLQTNFKNMGAAGRWLFKGSMGETGKFHAGVNGRFLAYDSPTTLTLSSTIESNVTEIDFLTATITDVKNDLSYGAEALFMLRKIFVRGEYTIRQLTKERDDESLYAAQSYYSSFEAWQNANPIRTNTFSGFYLEGGYLLLGDGYKYDEKSANVAGGSKGDLEIVGRYSFTQLNDVVDGDIFAVDRFYQNGNPYDYTSQSSSVGGGLLQSMCVGANYYITNGVLVMLNYTYSMLNNPYFADLDNMSTVQLRLSLRF